MKIFDLKKCGESRFVACVFGPIYEISKEASIKKNSIKTSFGRIGKAMAKHLEKNQRVLYLRFWNRLVIGDISKKMDMEWKQMGCLIEKSLKMLNKALIEEFYRSRE